MRLLKLLIMAGMVVAVYILFGLYLYYNQISMLYFPDNQDFQGCPGFQQYQKTTFNGTRFYLRNGSDQVIIVYHGNAGSACDRSFMRPFFEASGKTLLFVEYAGYSGDINEPSMTRILADVSNVRDYIKSYTDVTVYGESIGSGPASYHASLGNVNRLILVAPFSTLSDVAQSIYVIYPADIILTERYDNMKWLSSYKGNVYIMHGDNDKVIPAKFSKKLYDALSTKNKEYVIIEGKGHNDIWTSKELVEHITAIVE